MPLPVRYDRHGRPRAHLILWLDVTAVARCDLLLVLTAIRARSASLKHEGFAARSKATVNDGLPMLSYRRTIPSAWSFFKGQGMMRRIAILIMVLGAFGAVRVVDAADVQRPNVLMIFTDDHGYADLGRQGVFEDVKTPNIDALVDGGVRMTSGYVTAPQCVPSRAGLMTGRYQTRFGVESNGKPLDGFNAQQTIAERLEKAGYATGMTGKWHLGPGPEIVQHGFDDVFYKNSNRPGWANFDLEGKTVPPGPENCGLYHLDANSAAARAFIKRHHGEPFFFYLAYRAPHVPLDSPAKYTSRFPGKMPERRRKALAMLSAVDDGIGSIMETLREVGLEQNTLIFLIGDNGAPLKIHKFDAPGIGPGWDGSLNDPLNGEKGMLSEGGIRVPFVVYWKGQLAGGQLYDQPVISLDVAATAVALAGLPSDPSLDGVNLIPYLRGDMKGPPHKTLFWRWIAQSAVREGQWKYLRGGAREYLYDLSTDKEEKHNVLAMHPEIARRLRGKLTEWAAQLDPPGIETAQMSTVWEQYYDFYLDGKPAPPLRRGQANRAAKDTKIMGWIARNSTAVLKQGVLQVRPGAGAARHPFIAAAQLSIRPPMTAMVRMRTPAAGTAGFAWREQGQNDFPPKQRVTFRCTASGEWQEHEVAIPAHGKLIHVRLQLPPGGADIQRIEIRDTDQKPVKTWHFGPAS